jgi:hypothetical protein
MALYLIDDFDISPSGTLRDASTEEAIAQDIAHLVEEADELGEATTDDLASLLRGQLLAMLVAHPLVVTVDQINITPGDLNTLNIAVFVNGNPTAITTTSGG